MTKRLVLIVFILFSVITTGQERTSSPYSFYGIGSPTFRGTVETKSMGGLSFFSDSIHINLQNPAAYGRLRLTTYTLGASHTSVNIESQDDSGTAKSTSLDYLAIGLPTGKFGFGFGLIPYTSVGYNILDLQEEEGYAARYSGRGGLNKVFLAAGYGINENISVGLDINYNFGNIQNKSLLVKEDVQYGSREINRSDLSGLAYTLGLDYERMLNEDLQLKFGMTFTPEVDLSSDNQREIATITFSPTGAEVPVDREEIEIPSSDLTLPSSFSIGTGIGRPQKWFLGAEYEHSGAADYGFRSFALEGASYSPASSYRIGGFYIPDYTSLTSYFSRITYRAGARMEETGLSLEGEAINEFGISFGLGLPAGRTFTNINLGFEYGQRGTTASGLIEENFFTAMISLSLNDRWFIKRRFE